jgi:hypothetical protein
MMRATTLTLTLAALAALTSGCSFHIRSGAGRADSYDHNYSARIGTSPEAPRPYPVEGPASVAQTPSAEGQPQSPAPAQATALPRSPRLQEAAAAPHDGSMAGNPTLITRRPTTNESSPTLRTPRLVLSRPTQGVNGRSTSSHTASGGTTSHTERALQPSATNAGRQLNPTSHDGRVSSTRSSMLQQSPRSALARPAASAKYSQRGLPSDGRAAKRANPQRRTEGAQPAGPSDSE